MKIMKKKNLLKFVLIVVLSALVLGVGYYFLFLNQNEAQNTVADDIFGWKYPITKFPSTGSVEIAYSDIRDPGGIPQGLPVRLKIPVIGVDSAIEDALITPDGRMDVPEGSKNVAWFSLGPHPGEEGSAVIGGHFGISNGVKFVFYDLDKIVVGDKIYIEDDKGDVLAFQVRSIELFDRNSDSTTVFSSNDGLAHLNLITCEGIWNKINLSYPKRRVIFSDLISPESGLSPVNVFSRTLEINNSGKDVTALQIILEQKGLLKIPSGVSRGFFGRLTRNAVIEYQKSVGLPPVGIFGPLTRARIVSEQSSVAAKPIIKPILPSTAITIRDSFSSSYIIKNLKTLYATPIDGLITSFLVILIIFMILAIVQKKKFKLY